MKGPCQVCGKPSGPCKIKGKDKSFFEHQSHQVIRRLCDYPLLCSRAVQQVELQHGSIFHGRETNYACICVVKTECLNFRNKHLVHIRDMVAPNLLAAELSLSSKKKSSYPSRRMYYLHQGKADLNRFLEGFRGRQERGFWRRSFQVFFLVPWLQYQRLQDDAELSTSSMFYDRSRINFSSLIAGDTFVRHTVRF